MRAAVYPGQGKPWTIETLDDPIPGPTDIIIRVHACGICGSDLHFTEGHQWDYGAGTVPGHEYAGEIIEIGRDVSDLKKGDLVTAIPSGACGQCEGCKTGNHVLCHKAPGAMGGFAEYVRVPGYLALKLPQTLSLTDGALVEPLAVGRYGVRQARIEPWSRVLVLGAGPVALSAIYWARIFGAHKIVAMSRAERRREMVVAMGADGFIRYGEDEIADAAEALGGPPDVVIEATGQPAFLMKAITHVRPCGEVVALGFCTQPDTFSPAVTAYKGVSLHFPVGYAREDFLRAFDRLDGGGVDPKMMISATVTLNDLPATITRLRGPHEETKVHVLPG